MSFKIFYSWQSDLEASNSRSIIQEAIKSAVQTLGSEMEDVEADRDTLNTTGSPDIAQTIFSKIDEADLFIADVTCVSEMQFEEELKKSPNPNVLVELGYAAGILGWDRIICVINTDYGKIEELPFDIRCRRVTPFSLCNKTKKEIIESLKNIIMGSAFTLKDKAKNTGRKDTFAKHKIYGYDYKRQEISECLVPYDPKENINYKKQIEQLSDQCSLLVEKIVAVKLELSEPIKEAIVQKNDFCGLPKQFGLGDISYVYSRLNKDKAEEIQEYLKIYLNIEVDGSFFDVGHLKQNMITFQPITGFHSEPEKIGTESEIHKFNLLTELQMKILEFKILECVCGMFDDFYIFPLVISNESTMLDENIDVTIEYEGFNPIELRDEIGFVEVDPGFVYEKELLKRILYIQDNRIEYDTDITETKSDIWIKQQVNQFRALGTFKFDRDDYERDIQKYLVRPDCGGGIAKYYISNLKPGEKKFLGAALLMKKNLAKVDVKYLIKSDQSDGKLNGMVAYSKNHDC